MTDRQKPKKLQPKKLETRQASTQEVTNKEATSHSIGSHPSGLVPPGGLTTDLSSNLERVKQEIGHQSDIRFREFKLGGTNIRAAIIFIDGLTDVPFLDEHVIKPLMLDFTLTRPEQEQLTDMIKDHFLTVSGVKKVNTLKEVIAEVFFGFTALLIDGSSDVLVIPAKNVKSRNIEEPVTETLVRGPRIGFNETLSDNTALMRLRVPDPNLTMIHYQVGERAKKNLVVVYMKGIANDELVAEVKRRIEKINIDDVPESGYIEQLIEDNPFTPFPQMQNTERPDRVISALMEGRVAILLDGTPFALIAPVTFSMLLQSPEDYYERWIPSTLIRFMRYLSAFVSLFLPSIYIAFISFHQGLIPTKLAIYIAGTREGVPFPSLIESLIMEVSIEILREAGLRLPQPVGQTVGLVGGLVIGEAAVRAGIVSPIMVIVVAVTAISSFAIPQYGAGISLRLLRFSGMFAAAFLGLYGVILFFLMLAIHFVKLKSFGVPYVTPAAPYRLNDWKDLIIRMPLFMMIHRPKMMFTKDKVRQKQRK